MGNGDSRLVLKLPVPLAPIKVNVLPLIKKRHAARAYEIYEELRKHFMVSYDEAGTIGKRYRRGDAIGTPYAITIDDQTLKQNTVTLRMRDTMDQVILSIEEVIHLVKKESEFHFE